MICSSCQKEILREDVRLDLNLFMTDVPIDSADQPEINELSPYLAQIDSVYHAPCGNELNIHNLSETSDLWTKSGVTLSYN
jgi:hypothetical protein